MSKSKPIRRFDYDIEWPDLLKSLSTINYSEDDPHDCIIRIIAKLDLMTDVWDTLIGALLMNIQELSEGICEMQLVETTFTDQERREWDESLYVYQGNLAAANKIKASASMLRERMITKAQKMRSCTKQEILELVNVN